LIELNIIVFFVFIWRQLYLTLKKQEVVIDCNYRLRFDICWNIDNQAMLCGACGLASTCTIFFCFLVLDRSNTL
jgi:hypothetical protein